MDKRLFDEILKIVNCECDIVDDTFTVYDMLYKPVLNIGGYKFCFDDNDNQIRSLLGGNGALFEVPFDYQTNDKLRSIVCRGINSFSVSKVELDNKNNETSSIKVFVDNSKRDLLELIMKKNCNLIHFKFEEDETICSCVIKISNSDNFVNEDIEIQYKCDKRLKKRLLSLTRNHCDRLNDDNGYYSSATVMDEYYDVRNGKFVAKYNTSDDWDEFDNTVLMDEQVDLYMEDLCSNIIFFIDCLKSQIGEISSTLYDVILESFTGFNDFQNVIYNSHDYGIIKTIFANYLKDKSHFTKIKNTSFKTLNS